MLHVIDITSHDVDEKIKVVEKVLSDLNAIDIPRINVFNKIDLLDAQPVNNNRVIFVSAKNETGLNTLKEAIENALTSKHYYTSSALIDTGKIGGSCEGVYIYKDFKIQDFIL